MKTGKTLAELAAELERQQAAKRDYIAPQGKIDAVVLEGEVVLDGINGDPKAITNLAHGQFAQHLKIPQAYYDRMKAEQPDLLAANLNGWLHADPANKRMIRTLDGKVRAVLSPKYRPLDNFDLATAILPVLQDKGVEIMSAQLTETRMYIKGILPSLSDELPEGIAYGAHARIGTDRGHLVSAITIANSEVGMGTLLVTPSVFTTWCANLAQIVAAVMRKYHVGRSFDADTNWEVFRDATREADDKAFWLKVADVTNAAFDETSFRAAIDSIRRAADAPITSDDLPTVVDLAVEELSLPKPLAGGLLKALAAGGDLTQWGLSSAITRVANDADDYEVATQLERAGGEVLALPAARWDAIADARKAA